MFFLPFVVNKDFHLHMVKIRSLYIKLFDKLNDCNGIDDDNDDESMKLVFAHSYKPKSHDR